MLYIGSIYNKFYDISLSFFTETHSFTGKLIKHLYYSVILVIIKHRFLFPLVYNNV